MSDKIYLGSRLSDFDIGEPSLPVSKVILNVDSETCFIAGDDTGSTIEQDCPWATQAMADSVLAKMKGFIYKPYSGTDALLDPAAEIGDALTVGGTYGILAQMGRNLDRQSCATIGAPGIDEIEDEYPYKSKQQKKTDRILAKTYSRITKTAEEIRLEILGEDAVNTLIKAAVDEIELSVSSSAGSSTFILKAGETELSTKTLNLTVDAVNITGKLTANQINADELQVKAANITGTIIAERLQGKIVYLRDSDGENQGRITIDKADTADYALDIRSYGAMRLTADEGDIFIAADTDNDGPFIQLHSGKGEVRSGGGNFCPNEDVLYSCGTKARSWTDVYINGTSLVEALGSLESRIEALGG